MPDITLTLSHRQQTTVTTALVQAAITWADPTTVIEVLNLVYPEPDRPWEEIVEDARVAKESLGV